jgi:hypothetical protein
LRWRWRLAAGRTGWAKVTERRRWGRRSAASGQSPGVAMESVAVIGHVPGPLAALPDTQAVVTPKHHGVLRPARATFRRGRGISGVSMLSGFAYATGDEQRRKNEKRCSHGSKSARRPWKLPAAARLRRPG